MMQQFDIVRYFITLGRSVAHFLIFLSFNVAVGQTTDVSTIRDKSIQEKYFSIKTTVKAIRANCATTDLEVDLESEISNISNEKIIIRKDHLLDSQWSFTKVAQTVPDSDERFVGSVMSSNAIANFDPSNYRKGSYIVLLNGKSFVYRHTASAPLSSGNFLEGVDEGKYVVKNKILTWRTGGHYADAFKKAWKEHEEGVLWTEPLLTTTELIVSKPMTTKCVAKSKKR